MLKEHSIKSLQYGLIILLLLMAVGIVVGGNIGIKLNTQKIENIDSNPIYVELHEKVKSGELEVDKELGFTLVQGMRDAHVDAGKYLESIFGIFISVGIFMLFLTSILAFTTWRFYKRCSNESI